MAEAAALCARVGLLACVDAAGRGQAGLVGELVRPLARVHPVMSDQVVLVAEALAAAGALEWLMYRVSSPAGA